MAANARLETVTYYLRDGMYRREVRQRPARERIRDWRYYG
jgi:hypothetical protein